MLRPATRRLVRVERALGPLANPVTGIVIWLAIMYVWHMPALYDAATENPLIHVLEHFSFFAAGLALWWPLVQPVPMRHRLTGLQPLGYIGGAKAGLAALGIYLAWSSTALYPFYEDDPADLGPQPRRGPERRRGDHDGRAVVDACARHGLGVRARSDPREEEQRRRERLEEARVPLELRG